MGYLALADVMNSLAEPAQALVAVEKAMHLDPSHKYRDEGPGNLCRR